MGFTINGERGFCFGKYFTHALATNSLKLGKLLVQSADLYGLTVFYPSSGRLNISGHKTQYGRFSGAVSSQNARALPWPNTPGNVSQHLVFIKADTNIFDIHHVFAKTCHRQTL